MKISVALQFHTFKTILKLLLLFVIAPLSLPSVSAQVSELFNNNNISSVANAPNNATILTLEQSTFVTYLSTYHWNQGQGKVPGTLALENEAGLIFGPWPVTPRAGQFSVANANWDATPNETLPPGVYTVIDSDPATWSNNGASGGRGFAVLRGIPSTFDTAALTILDDPGTSLQNLRARVGQSMLFQITGRTGESVWGTDVYTDDSDLGTAAVHAGAASKDQQVIVRVTLLPGRNAYESSTRNGVQSASFGVWEGSFRIDPLEDSTVILSGEKITLFDNGNIGSVINQPKKTTVATFDQPSLITFISTYHWNSGKGDEPGTIALQNTAGEILGPWTATPRDGQGGVSNANWDATPKVLLPAGSYTIVDSNPETWSQNAESDHRGFVIIQGVPGTTLGRLNQSIVETTGLDSQWQLKGDALWFAQGTETNNGATAMQSGDIDHGESSRIETTVVGPGTINFAWKTSTEASDQLQFLLDDMPIQQIGGETSWQEFSFPVRWGEHVLSWVFQKDTSVDQGADAVWLDNIRYSPVQLTEIDQVLSEAPQPINLSGDAPWFGQNAVLYQGNPTAQTGNITHQQSSRMSLSVFGPGSLSFAWKTASESSDRLRFLDGDQVISSVSGNIDWKEESVPLRWGPHQLTWEYLKDQNIHTFDDAGWVSQIIFNAVEKADLPVALDNDTLTWSTTESSPWFGQGAIFLKDSFAAQSGNITHAQQTDLQTTVTGPAVLAFRWKTSSEGSDPTQFLMDGTALATISGDTDWQTLAYAIAPGEHQVIWRYQKDHNSDSGHDAAWVDQVELVRSSSITDILTIREDPNGGLQSFRTLKGQVLIFQVTGRVTGNLWGTDTYTDDSTLGKAAVHAGILRDGETGLIQVVILPGQSAYEGTLRNGVKSDNFGSWEDKGSFRVESVINLDLAPTRLTVTLNADGNIRLSWNSGSDGWGIESSSRLSPGASWSPLILSPTKHNGESFIIVPIEQSTRYFRLRR